MCGRARNTPQLSDSILSAWKLMWDLYPSYISSAVLFLFVRYLTSSTNFWHHWTKSGVLIPPRSCSVGRREWHRSIEAAVSRCLDPSSLVTTLYGRDVPFNIQIGSTGSPPALVHAINLTVDKLFSNATDNLSALNPKPITAFVLLVPWKSFPGDVPVSSKLKSLWASILRSVIMLSREARGVVSTSAFVLANGSAACLFGLEKLNLLRLQKHFIQSAPGLPSLKTWDSEFPNFSMY